MTAKAILRTTGRWLAAGVGFAAASYVAYVAYVGYVWAQYGNVSPPTCPAGGWRA